MKQYIITVYTSWCGMDQQYSAIAEYSDDLGLEETAQQLAYDNFSSFDCRNDILEELFPNSEDYTQEQEDQVTEVEGEYYSYSIDEYDRDEHDSWDMFELIYDASNGSITFENKDIEDDEDDSSEN